MKYFRNNGRERNRWKGTEAWHKKCGSKLKAKDGELRYLCKQCNEYVESDSQEVTHDQETAILSSDEAQQEEIRKQISRMAGR